MDVLNVLMRMFDHEHWANSAVLESFQSSPDNEEARKLFSHILAADLLWHGRITGNLVDSSELWRTLSLAELEERTSQVRMLWEHIFTELQKDPSRLEEPVFYTNTKGDSFRNSLRDILTHVALHAHYHRGQIARLLKSDGGVPAYTDFIQFARLGQLSDV